ncbi:hypothetical protein [Luteolibacter soli]|uniref:Uncharacterized protein n=1 Tax=Luteolibacter soli TaxID=3135280 RepID=A0ABU9AXC4_9BACT
MIPLDEAIWHQLSCHNITGREFAKILKGYYAGTIPGRKALQEDLLQCICGGNVYDSALAAAPHLTHLASRCDPSSAAVMLEFAAMAIAEASTGNGPRFDPRLTGPLREAACAGVIETMRVLESPNLDTFTREEMEAALLAFSGDIEGYRNAIAEINAWWEGWSSSPQQVTEMPAPLPRNEVIWGDNSPSSQTSSGEE